MTTRRSEDLGVPPLPHPAEPPLPATVWQFPLILGPHVVLEMARRQRERATEAAGGVPRREEEGLLLPRGSPPRAGDRAGARRGGEPGRLLTTCDGCPPARPRGVHRSAGLPPPAHRPGGLLEGASIKAELTGTACRTGVTYPLVTGDIGPSLLDFGARRLARFGEDQLLVGVPFHRLISIMHALDRGAGGSREEKPEVVEGQIEELGRVEAA